ncbi:MAG: hypothetical protein FWC16_02205 [Defluviitaleaceae bacterium]|nr:hypothetical protein [Defluviitaleaceae bacterium]MCL2273712.1 hypothetical protein [Defluviitaleaceae bacterium]
MSRVKSLLIVCLAALAIYQTGLLWFVNITNRSFFIYFTQLFDRGVPDGYTDIIRPRRVIYGNGDGFFTLRYGERSEMANSAITEILARGVFNGIVPAETALTAALQAPVILHEYAFPLRAEIFATAFSQRSTILSDRGIDAITRVAVLNEGVIFMDETHAWAFNLPVGTFELDTVYIDRGLFFVSDEQTPWVFIPRTEAGYRHHPIRVVNPYANRSGEVQLNSVNAQVSHFFDNPAVRNPRMEENVITISTINTVVRYLPGNVLEFNCFRPIRRREAPNFMTDFSAAVAFINNDVNVQNDFLLARYEVRGRTHVFWFSYVIRDEDARGFPLIAPQGGWGSAAAPLFYPIEVVVDHGRVSRYRKVAFIFELDATQHFALSQDAFNPQGAGASYIFGYPAIHGAGLVLYRVGGGE